MKKLLLFSFLFPACVGQSVSAMPAFSVKVPFADKVAGLVNAAANVEISDSTKTAGKIGLGVLGVAAVGYAGYKLYHRWFGSQPVAEPVVSEVRNEVEEIVPVVEAVVPVVRQEAPAPVVSGPQKSTLTSYAKKQLNDFFPTTDSQDSLEIEFETMSWDNDRMADCAAELELILSGNNFRVDDLTDESRTTLTQIKDTLNAIVQLGTSDKRATEINKNVAYGLINHFKNA